MIKITNDFKIIEGDGQDTYLVNGIFPLHRLINYVVYHREFTKERGINYLKKYFNVDITEVVNNMWFDWVRIDIYDEFLKQHPRTDYDETNRKYFVNRGRKYFVKFVDWCEHYSEQDFLSPQLKSKVIHHIHPLVYGGTNRLENLVNISDVNHEILHENPLEEFEKHCHQAIFYLWFLNYQWDSEKNKYLSEKYPMKEIIETKNPQLIYDFWVSIVKSEMRLFYEKISAIHSDKQ